MTGLDNDELVRAAGDARRAHESVARIGNRILDLTTELDQLQKERAIAKTVYDNSIDALKGVIEGKTTTLELAP